MQSTAPASFPSRKENSSYHVSPSTRLRGYYEHLIAHYGPQSWWPSRTRFETIVGAYLVQNTSWRGVIRSISHLEAHGALHVDGLRALPLEDLRVLIRPSGYMIRKSLALHAFIAFLDQQYDGSLDRLAAAPTAVVRTQLLALTGVGPETADAILLYALDHPVMVVDEYLRRIAHRHDLTPVKANYDSLQKLALDAFASDPPPTRLQHFNEFHALIVEVGKNHCGPRPRCEQCPLKSFLPLATAPDGGTSNAFPGPGHPVS